MERLYQCRSVARLQAAWLARVIAKLGIATFCVWLTIGISSVAAQMSDEVLNSIRIEMRQRLNALPGVKRVTETSQEMLEAETSEGTTVEIFLGNIAADVRSGRSIQSERIGVVVKMVAERSTQAPNERNIVLTTIKPLIRSRSYVSNITTEPDKTSKNEVVWKPLLGDAVVVLATDSDGSVTLVQSSTLEKAGISKIEAFEQALTNLRALAGETMVEKDGAVRSITLERVLFAPSLMLLPEVWEALAANLGPNILVAVPNRESLIAVAANNAPALSGKLADIERIEKMGPMITNVFKWGGGSWVALPLPQ